MVNNISKVEFNPITYAINYIRIKYTTKEHIVCYASEFCITKGYNIIYILRYSFLYVICNRLVRC